MPARAAASACSPRRRPVSVSASTTRSAATASGSTARSTGSSTRVASRSAHPARSPSSPAASACARRPSARACSPTAAVASSVAARNARRAVSSSPWSTLIVASWSHALTRSAGSARLGALRLRAALPPAAAVPTRGASSSASAVSSQRRPSSTDSHPSQYARNETASRRAVSASPSSTALCSAARRFASSALSRDTQNRLAGPEPLAGRLHGEPDEPVAVPPPYLRLLPGRGEPVQAVRADRLEHPVARPATRRRPGTARTCRPGLTPGPAPSPDQRRGRSPDRRRRARPRPARRRPRTPTAGTTHAAPPACTGRSSSRPSTAGCAAGPPRPVARRSAA